MKLPLIKNVYVKYLFVILIAIILHLIFFRNVFLNDHIIYSGKDMVRGNYASNIILYEGLLQGYIPITTDKAFGLYPIFFSSHYYNLISLSSVFIFGPYYSVHFQIILIYLIGFISLYYFLDKYFSVNINWKLVLCYLYFYNFIVLSHYQHVGIIFSIFLFPTIILLTKLFYEKKNIIYPVLVSMIYYFIAISNSYQYIILNFLIQTLFIYLHTNSFRHTVKSIFVFFVPFLIISLPTIYYFSLAYLNTERSVSILDLKGYYDLKYFGLYVLPFFFGTENYFGTSLSRIFIQHETLIYFSLSLVTIGFLICTSMEIRKNFYRKFFLLSVFIFILICALPIFPFDKFRYWVRGHYVVNFSLILLIAAFLSSNIKEKFSLKKISILILPIFLVVINFIDSDLRFQFKTYFSDYNLLTLTFIGIFILTVYLYFKHTKYLALVVIFEILVSLTIFDFNLTIPVSEVNAIRSQVNNYYELNDDYSLLKQGPSLSYAGSPAPLREPYTQEIIDKTFNMTNFLQFKFSSIFFFVIYFLFLKRFKRNLF